MVHFEPSNLVEPFSLMEKLGPIKKQFLLIFLHCCCCEHLYVNIRRQIHAYSFFKKGRLVNFIAEIIILFIYFSS